MIDAAVIILKNNKGEVLLLNRKSPPFGYGLPGGKVEEDEAFHEACLRKLKEETGIILKYIDITYVDNSICDRYLHNVYIFKSDVIIDESDVKITSEHSDYIFTKDFDSVNLAGKTLEFINM